MMTPTLLFNALLLLHGNFFGVGAAELTVADGNLDKCCDLGGSWAGQKLRCERFQGPVPGLDPLEQTACLEAVDICCRKAYQEEVCTLGRNDARIGAHCNASGPMIIDLDEYRRDCCEGCKLGILTGSSGKGCAFEKFSMGVSWEPAFMECCNEAMTSTSRKSSSTTATTSSRVSKSTDATTESEEIDNGIDETTDSSSSTDSKLGNLCQLMRGMLCAEICVSTPGSYYCQCREGSTLEEDGRSCKSNNITTEEQKTTLMDNSSVPMIQSSSINVSTSSLNSTSPSNTSTSPKWFNRSTSSISFAFSNLTSSTKVESSHSSNPAVSSASYQPPISSSGKKSMWSVPPSSAFKVFTIDAKLRTTRSSPTEDNELSLPCPAGYRFTPSTETCDDIDECSVESTPICPPGSGCINANGSYRCVQATQRNGNEKYCELGYRWNSTLGRCFDVDECLENIHKCLIDAENCRNLEGSYECEIKCENGFVFNGNYGACLDINECIELTNVCLQPDTICVNTLGSFECRNLKEYQQPNEPSNVGSYDRRTGDYEGLDKRVDIDECRVREQPCSPGEICRNTVGGYDCIPGGCPRGFVLANEACQDMDECELGLHSCGAHERCQNTNGSFTCEQPRLTPRNPTTEPPNLACRKGYKADNESGICVDIDECVEGPGCRDHERCRNLQGSYDCSPLCGPGWYFQLQTKTCQDVDECLLGHHNCRQRTQYCRNTNGSYVCEALTACPSGYRRDQNGGCTDLDECLEGVHTCSRESHRYCVNREGGYECITRLPSCSRGFEYSLLTHQCEDVDECRSGRASCESRLSERCVNLPGSYRCERPQSGLRAQKQRPACPAGYSYDVAQRKCSGKGATTGAAG